METTRRQRNGSRRTDSFRASGGPAGPGSVLHIAGTLRATRGDFAPRERTCRRAWRSDASSTTSRSMGRSLEPRIMAEYEGDFERWRSLHEKGLALRLQAGDNAGIAVSLIEPGNRAQGSRAALDEARAQIGGEPATETRDRRPAAIALGEHNLGLLTREQGDYDRTRDSSPTPFAFSATRATSGRSPSCSRTSLCSPCSGEPGVALRFAGAGAAVRDEIGVPRGPGGSGGARRQLASAREALGEQADSVWDAGRSSVSTRPSARRSRSARAIEAQRCFC